MGKTKRGLKSKNQYQRLIAEYTRRRDEIREYCHWKGRGDTTQYLILTVNLTKKIGYWRRMIRRIENRELRLKMIDEVVSNFFNLPKLKLIRKHRQYSRDERIEMAVRVFCKYAIENRFCSRWISYYLGCRCFRTASYARLRFNRSFKTKPNNLKVWHSFREYINLYKDGKQAQVLHEYSNADRDRLVCRAEQGRRVA